MVTIISKISKLFLLIIGLILSMNAYPAAWLNDGFDWSLPWYASTAQNGGMLDVNGGPVILK